MMTKRFSPEATAMYENGTLNYLDRSPGQCGGNGRHGGSSFASRDARGPPVALNLRRDASGISTDTTESVSRSTSLQRSRLHLTVFGAQARQSE